MSPIYYPFWILLFAILMFVLEAFLPSGGVLGVLSAVGFVAAISSAFAYGGLKLGTAFMAGTAVLLPVLFVILIKVWPMTPFGKRILIQPPDSSQLVPKQRRQRQQLVGQLGIAVSPLLPAGAIRIQGRTFDAISDGVTIEKGAMVEVIAVRNNAIVVRPARTPTAETPPAAVENGSLDAVIPDPFDDRLS